jgi:integrase
MLSANQQEKLKQYLGLLALEQKSKHWLSCVNKWLNEFVQSVDVQNVSQVTEYLKNLQDKMHPVTYKKEFYQIRRFLRESLELNYLDKIRLPRVNAPLVKIVTNEDIRKTVEYFSNSKFYLRYRAFILLMSSSGLRPSEAWQLKLEDIDFVNRKIYIRVDAKHHTKTGKARVAFFNEKTQFVLERYIKQNKNRRIFNESHFSRAFRHAPLRVKEFRKFFSQEWTRRNGNHAVKEILMGHAQSSVDAQHYLALSEEDLKRIYDKVME